MKIRKYGMLKTEHGELVKVGDYSIPDYALFVNEWNGEPLPEEY
jgi:hypothetical protein